MRSSDSASTSSFSSPLNRLLNSDSVFPTFICLGHLCRQISMVLDQTTLMKRHYQRLGLVPWSVYIYIYIYIYIYMPDNIIGQSELAPGQRPTQHSLLSMPAVAVYRPRPDRCHMMMLKTVSGTAVHKPCSAGGDLFRRDHFQTNIRGGFRKRHAAAMWRKNVRVLTNGLGMESGADFDFTFRWVHLQYQVR